jgi:hypothetical protein
VNRTSIKPDLCRQICAILKIRRNYFAFSFSSPRWLQPPRARIPKLAPIHPNINRGDKPTPDRRSAAPPLGVETAVTRGVWKFISSQAASGAELTYQGAKL